MAGFLDFLDDPRSLNDMQSGLEVGGHLAQARSRFEFGAQQNEAAQFAAQQYRQQALEAQASSQRSAWDADQSAKYLASQTLARAAASGGGASDPTVVNIMARIAQEGAYRSSLALYGGDERARLMNLQASAKEREGALQETQSNAAGTGSLFQAGASLLKGYQKDSTIMRRFGGDGPPQAWRG